MSDVLSLLGFYLALVGLLSSVFFTALDKWRSDVRVAVRLWSVDHQVPHLEIKKLEDHYQRALSAQSACPLWGFALVAFFLVIISISSVLLGLYTQPSPVSLLFVYVPGAIFEILFIGGSLWLLWRGRKDIDATLSEIEEKM